MKKKEITGFIFRKLTVKVEMIGFSETRFMATISDGGFYSCLGYGETEKEAIKDAWRKHGVDND